MIIFVVNCGSSSIKYQLLNMNGEQVLAKGLIERIGMEGSVLKHTPTGKYTVDISAEIPDHSVGIQMALDALTNEEYGVIDSIRGSSPGMMTRMWRLPGTSMRHL